MTNPPAANEPDAGRTAAGRDTAADIPTADPSSGDSSGTADTAGTGAAADPSVDTDKDTHTDIRVNATADTNTETETNTEPEPTERLDVDNTPTRELPGDPGPTYEADYLASTRVEDAATAETTRVEDTPADDYYTVAGAAGADRDVPEADAGDRDSTDDGAAANDQPAGPPLGPPPDPPPPPGAGPPPPPGAGPPPPPPFGPPPPGFGPFGPFGAKFDRTSLVRPLRGRYAAGVCAAIGRATNTDPVLWRVVLAALTLFGGIGLLAYLVGWLLIPAEGDTASPIEALLGRGRSSMSGGLAVVLGVGAVLTFGFIVSDHIGAASIGLLIVLGVAVLIIRNNQGGQQGTPPPPPYGYQPPGAGPTGPPFPGAPTTGGWPVPPTPYPPTPPNPSGPGMMPTQPPQPVPAGAAGYRPPFAPHGPYASSSPYATSLGYPPAGTPYPGLGAQPAPKPPKPPKPKSRLGRVTLSVVCLVFGVIGVLDLAFFDIHSSTFIAAALATIGAGLVVGARVGRARWLIPIGAILTLGLIIVTAERNIDPVGNSTNIDVSPAVVDAIMPEYVVDVGNVRLDLSNVDFTDRSIDLYVSIRVGGNLTIILPPNVDTTAEVDLNGGQCQLFNQRTDGLNRQLKATDYGNDGVGGGNLRIKADVGFGNVEVDR